MTRKAKGQASAPRQKSANQQSTAGKPSAKRSAQSETRESKPRQAASVKPEKGVTRHADEGNGRASKEGRLSRAVSAVKKVFTRGGRSAATAEEATPPAPRSTKQAGGQKAQRVARRQADIPMDVLDKTYTPGHTSSRSSFRDDGADHHSDQEFAAGVADERWNDEDRLTNKSNDPRIGTHGRAYEPGETRAESRD
ncbi:MAG TPA: hypothetical protein VFN10_12855 [Thermoanaerobaculia bacterium]|nr:hypothetical protein [Thermoanaerobaculia bacterium]